MGVDADQGLLAGIDARLRARGGLLDAQFRNAFLDRGGHAAKALHFLDVGERPRREVCVSRST